MRGREVAEKIEPENRKLRQHLAFIGNARGQDVVERRDAVGRDNQQTVADAIYIAHFAAAVAFHACEIGFENDGIFSGVHDRFSSRIGGVLQMITRLAELSTRGWLKRIFTAETRRKAKSQPQSQRARRWQSPQSCMAPPSHCWHGVRRGRPPGRPFRDGSRLILRRACGSWGVPRGPEGPAPHTPENLRAGPLPQFLAAYVLLCGRPTGRPFAMARDRFFGGQAARGRPKRGVRPGSAPHTSGEPKGWSASLVPRRVRLTKSVA